MTSLDGDLDRSFSENVKQRFEAMNWEVLYVEDGNNIEELTAAIEKARQNEKKPTLIEVKRQSVLVHLTVPAHPVFTVRRLVKRKAS